MDENVYGPPDMSLWLQRPLGYWEKQMIKELPAAPGPRRCTINSVTNIVLNNGYTLDVNHFKAAVMATVYNEPHLRADVDLKAKPEAWAPATNFSEVFNYVDLREKGIESLSDLMPLIDEEANRAWEYGSGKPLYRCTLIRVVKEYVIMNCYHHAAGDGTTAMLILGGIMKQYNRLEDGLKVELAPLHPRPSAEDVTSGVHDDAMVNKMIEDKLRKAKTYIPYLPLDVDEIEENNKTDFPVNNAEFRSGTVEALSTIISNCREHGVTVGALSVAASYLATAAVHAQLSCSHPMSYKGMKNEYLDVLINIRSRISPQLGVKYCAFYVTEFATILDVNLDSSLWQLAKEVKKQFKCLFDQQQHLLYCGVKKKWETGEHRELACTVLPVGYTDIAFSNLGRYPFEYAFKWGRIMGNFLAGAIWCPEFSNYFFNILSTDRLHYSSVYCPGKRNAEVSHKLFDIFYKVMEGSKCDMTLRDILVNLV